MVVNAPLRVGSLFAGIGGFDLGFERAGMETAFFVEREPYCQAVLRKHWPDVPIFDDVCAVGADCLPTVDVLCGGFPCQDLSSAGKGAGLDGTRSGLWSEYARLIGELRPRYVVVENVPMLRSRGLGRVLGEMAALGYDAEWDCLPASAFGAPHRRDRIWILAYEHATAAGPRPLRPLQSTMGPITDRERQSEHGQFNGRPAHNPPDRGPLGAYADGFRETVADAASIGGWAGDEEAEYPGSHGDKPSDGGPQGDPWLTEPDVGRVANGVPSRVDRLRALGNALVPQIAEWIGHRIVEYEASCER